LFISSGFLSVMDSVFFWLSKLLWLVVSPSSLLVFVVLVGWVALMRGAYRLAKGLFGLMAISMLFIAVFPLGQWLFMPLEPHFQTNPPLPDKVDGIIVLSGPERALTSQYWQQAELGEGAERNLAFMALAQTCSKTH
jgi:uncharacterized SAM-binding protein YcdF (DUF218 family)